MFALPEPWTYTEPFMKCNEYRECLNLFIFSFPFWCFLACLQKQKKKPSPSVQSTFSFFQDSLCIYIFLLLKFCVGAEADWILVEWKGWLLASDTRIKYKSWLFKTLLHVRMDACMNSKPDLIHHQIKLLKTAFAEGPSKFWHLFYTSHNSCKNPPAEYWRSDPER